MVESSSEYGVKVIAAGMEVYRNASDACTETIVIDVIDEVSSFEVTCLSIDCETTEVIDDIVVISEEKEESEILRTEDESACFIVLMSDIGTHVECNLVDSSNEMELQCLEQSSEWMKEIKQNDQFMETEKSEMANISVSSEVEYCTIDVEFEEQKPMSRESGFGTKSVTVDDYSAYEAQGQDAETESYGPVLINTAIATEHELEKKDICTETTSVTIDMNSEYCIDSVIIEVESEKEKDTADFGGSVDSKSIEVGSEIFGEKTTVLIDSLTTHETRIEMKDMGYDESISNVVDSESHSVTRSVDDVCSEEGVNVCDTGMDINTKYSNISSLQNPFSTDVLSYNMIPSVTATISTYLSTVPLSDVGVQIQILPFSEDFSQNYCCLPEIEFEPCSNLDFDEEFSNNSIASSDGLEWSEFGLELNSLPLTIATQTINIDLCSTFSCFEMFQHDIQSSFDIEESSFTSIATDCLIDEKEYIMKYIRTNISSELIKTIREIFGDNLIVKDSCLQTGNNETLVEWVVETFGINELRRVYKGDNYYIEESQNTDFILNRSVYTQSESTYFNEALSTFSAPFTTVSSDYQDEDQFISRRIDIFEEIDERRTVLEKEDDDLYQRNECQTQTNVIENRTAAVQTLSGSYEYISVVSEPNYEEDYLLGVTEYNEVDFESQTRFRRTASGITISDNETQTVFENRSCAIQTYFDDTDKCSMATVVDLLEENLREKVHFNIIERSKQTQTSDAILSRSNYIQTDYIDLSEPYWSLHLNNFLRRTGYFETQSIINVPADSSSQTEQIYIDSEIQTPKIDTTFLSPFIRSRTTTISDDVERNIREERTKKVFGELRYSSVTISSQTDPYLMRDDFESVFDDDIIARSSKFIMRTQATEHSLLEVIDSSMALPVDIKTVCHPTNNTKYTFNIALNRSWIDMKHGVYCNPSTFETMPIERAIELRKIELAAETKCPDVRRFGLFSEKTVTKIEKLRVKNVLNTETGDLYDERISKEIGILLENGDFLDKEANVKMSFQEAVLGNYIEVYYETELIDSTIDWEKHFKITNIRDTATGRLYNFHKALDKGLVNLGNATFRDTERNVFVKYEEALRRRIVHSTVLNQIDHLYIENEVEKHVIHREISLSSESYPSGAQSFRSQEFPNFQ